MASSAIPIRMDIDTIVCANSMNNMLQLADKLDCRFSFYINMGKAISIPAAISRRLALSNDFNKSISSPAKKLSIKQKLGIRGILKTVLLNNNLFPICKKELLIAKSYGHEIGLHGGMNHGIWQSYAKHMTDIEITSLLVPAIDEFTYHFGRSFGFTSPGFSINPHSYALLAKNGCRYVSDHVDITGKIKRTTIGELPDIPITLAAKGNIDFLESYIASNTIESLESIAKKSIGHFGYGAFYSHPCFVNNVGNKLFTNFVIELKKIATNKLMIDLL